MTRLGLVILSALALSACANNAGPTPGGKGCPMGEARDRDRIVDVLGSYPAKTSALGSAVLCDDRAGVESALRAGASPNQDEGDGFTPVIFAAAIPHTEILKVLLRSGGDPNRFTRQARTTALAFAMATGVAHDDWSAYRTLLDGGADINLRPPNGNTIADVAVSLGALDRLLDLLDRGYRNDLPDLLRGLEARHVDPASEPRRQQALERIRAKIAGGPAK